MAEKETSAQSIERLKAELAEAKEQLNAYKARQALADADEVIIREKMSHGLSREQAVSVIRRQRAHDEWAKGQTKSASIKKPQGGGASAH